MLDHAVRDLNNFYKHTRLFMPYVLVGLTVLWGINIVNWSFKSKLNFLALQPRNIKSLPCIFTYPIIHKNFNHLFFNSIPLFPLLLFSLKDGYIRFYKLTAIIVICSGLLLWLFGRTARHIGASGIISGYYGFVLANAFKNPGISTILLAVIALYYFSGIIGGILPLEDKVSWESHLFGFVVGIFSIDIFTFIHTF